MRIGMLKNEITAKKVTENEDGIGGGADSDEETNTQKYETGNKKRKEDDDDDEQESENEEKEEESEQEKTYDDVYQKTDDEDEKNINENESNEDEDKEEDEEDNNTNTEEITTTNDHTGSDNEINDNNSVSNEDNKKSTKNKNKNFQKAILERKTYIYNNITIDNMNFSSSKEDNSSIFYFDLFIPYSQKNILLKNILNIVLKKINFKSVKHIKRCHLLDKENKKGQKEYSIQLEGFNFEEVAKYSDLVDINHISTNDIGGVLSIYGIEACRSAIVKEIVNVFDVYSIKVNKRHLGLIADYITFQGKYRSFSRVGISYCSSPLLKMTYETTLQFLTEACETKSIDKGNTPSSRIMLGRPPKCGTGAFDIFQK
jgi:DNA-directed RNA polymerase I subunit RPA1